MTNNQPEQFNRVVAYIRKSSEDNDAGDVHKQPNSLEYQRNFIPKALRDYKLTLVREPFEDDKSGYEAFYRDGPNGFNAMLDYIKDKKGEVDGIVCTEISRLARNFADGGMILWYMQNGTIKRIYTPTKVFTNSSSDQLMVAIEFAMSKKSSDDTGYRTKEGMKAKARTMKHPSRPAILGYKTVGQVGAKKWVINKKIGPLVKDVFIRFSSDKYTFDQIADYAYQIGIRSKSKKSSTGKLSANSWRNRLRDEQYIGIFYNDGERTVGEYEHLIDSKIFYRVQEVIFGNKNQKGEHVDYAYSSLFKCERCGGFLTGINNKGITYYRCAKRKAPCKTMTRVPYVVEEDIERDFIREFNSIEIDQETWEASRSYVIELNQPEKLDLLKKIRTFGERIEAEKNLRTEIGRKYGNHDIEKIEHDALLQDSYQKETSYRNTISKLENISFELDALMGEFLDNIKNVTKRFENSLPKNKKEMIEIFCENLVWKDEKAQWDWRKPYFFLVKQPKSSTVLPR